MAALALLRWWYSEGLVALINRLRQYLVDIAQSFSVPILLGTLFAPWRQVVSYNHQSAADSLRSMLDNAVSRFVGFWVRLLTLLAACIILVFTALGGLILLISWPLLPLAAVALLVAGLLP
ncbi:MAG TPA: hypothetical protein VLF21_02165 [Candidatus Saccharimonadales bacterium]|nr:hypothetical protein [Candidatus Saccharimonadales bacterium]